MRSRLWGTDFGGEMRDVASRLLHSGLMEMKEAAEAYCRVIEVAQSADRGTFVKDVAVTLSAAVAVAYQLPDDWFESESDIEDSDESISNDQWYEQMRDIKNVLEEWDNYWTTFDAYRLDDAGVPDLGSDVTPTNEVNLSLADALADIWRELRNGLNALARGVPLGEVMWEWQFGFRIHWGEHAVDALRAIHQQVMTR